MNLSIALPPAPRRLPSPTLPSSPSSPFSCAAEAFRKHPPTFHYLLFTNNSLSPGDGEGRASEQGWPRAQGAAVFTGGRHSAPFPRPIPVGGPPRRPATGSVQPPRRKPPRRSQRPAPRGHRSPRAGRAHFLPRDSAAAPGKRRPEQAPFIFRAEPHTLGARGAQPAARLGGRGFRGLS